MDDEKKLIEDRYIGDGVYVSFDGFHIWFAANDHRNKVVALDPNVLIEFDRFRADLNKAIKEAGQ